MLSILGTTLLVVLIITILFGAGFFTLCKGVWKLLLKIISGISNAVRGIKNGGDKK